MNRGRPTTVRKWQSDRSDKNDGRDLALELEDGAAGELGLAVDARCIECKRVRAKRVPDRECVDDGRDSFRHVCHKCRGVTYWNILRELDALEDGGSA